MNSFLVLGLLTSIGFATFPLDDIHLSEMVEINKFESIKDLKYLLVCTKETIRINETKTVPLYKIPKKYYEFTPSADGYYAVETFGDKKTQLCVDSQNTGRIFDSGNEKKDDNAKIVFKGTKNKKVSIFLSSEINDENEHATLLVRKQNFSSFVFRAGTGAYDISTGNDNIVPKSLFDSTMNYNTYINSKYETIDGINQTKEALNSEVVFFSGHGSPTSLTFANQTRLSFSYTQYLSNPYSVLDMRQTKLAFLSACQTADNSMCMHPEEDLCIAEFLVQQGAKCSIGFESVISTSAGKMFSDYFFNKFYNGFTVAESVSYAKSQFEEGNPVLSVKIFGDENVSLTSFESNGEFYIPLILSLADVTFPLPPIIKEKE